jgi:ribosome-binding protein aMBF1 (putative translation factor)
MNVCHHCDNPRCVRPEHLFLGTQKENLADRERKGRTLKGERHWANQKPEKLARGSGHGNSRITEKDVCDMRKAYAEKQASQTELAKRYNMSQASINSILLGKTWAHAGGPITKRGRSKLTPALVREIRRMLANGISQSEISRRLGIGNSTIGAVARGESWGHIK